MLKRFAIGATLSVMLTPLASVLGNESEGRFLLGGTAQLAQDPENPVNDVIRIRTDVAPFFGSISRRVNVKISRLDNMLEFKVWFQAPKSCSGGSPRLQLAIDLNGDGTSEGNAFGYLGAGSTTVGCPPQTWLSEDMTGGGDNMVGLGPLPSTGQLTPNEELEWDLTQFVCPVTVPPTLPPGPPNDPCIAHPGFVTNWSTAETIINAFPKHLVCSVALVADTFAPVMTGTSYYDLFSAGGATWTDRRDIGRGFAMGCARPDHDDDDHAGDEDDDHEYDDDDPKFDNNRRERWKDD